MESPNFEVSDFLACCGSTRFAKEMASLSPFRNFDAAVESAREIWFNKVDVNGWLEAFSAHPQIGQTPSSHGNNDAFAQWSKGEQSTAIATASATISQELSEWNAKYREKFGFVFLIYASGRSTPEILDELKRRYSNRPIIELDNAAKEQMKITELRLAKLFSAKAEAARVNDVCTSITTEKAGEDRMNVIGSHLAPAASHNATQAQPRRTRPPITTHILDISSGRPAFDVEVRLEFLKGPLPSFQEALGRASGWEHLGSSKTNRDGRSGQLMEMSDALSPGLYRISFETGKYNPDGFYPFVSVVFEVKESQKFEHFHVPLLLSPFSFSTYRGS